MYQCILHNSTVFFFFSFLQISSNEWGGELMILGWINSAAWQDLFVPCLSILILKVSRNKILHHRLDFNVNCMMQKYFFSLFQNLLNWNSGDLISWGNQFCKFPHLLPFCVSILKTWSAQILFTWSEFNAWFSNIFLSCSKFHWKRGEGISWGYQLCRMTKLFIFQVLRYEGLDSLLWIRLSLYSALFGSFFLSFWKLLNSLSFRNCCHP